MRWAFIWLSALFIIFTEVDIVFTPAEDFPAIAVISNGGGVILALSIFPFTYLSTYEYRAPGIKKENIDSFFMFFLFISAYLINCLCNNTLALLSCVFEVLEEISSSSAISLCFFFSKT